MYANMCIVKGPLRSVPMERFKEKEASGLLMNVLHL